MDQYDETELRELMEEPPGGWCHGRSAPPLLPNHDGEIVNTAVRRDLDIRETRKLEGVGRAEEDRAHVVDARHGTGGLRAHRGVLYPGEFVDRRRLVAALEDALGVPLDVVRDVYGPRGGGPLPASLRELRAALDARLAAAADAGGSLALLAQLIGVGPRTLQRAAQRGRRNCRTLSL